MKRILLALALLITSAVAVAAPTASADVDAATARCGFYIDTNPVVMVNVTSVTPSPARPTGFYCQLDVGTHANGSHTVQISAFSANDAFGRVAESAKTVALNFTLPIAPAPTAPAVPQNPKLTAP